MVLVCYDRGGRWIKLVYQERQREETLEAHDFARLVSESVRCFRFSFADIL